MAAPPNTPSILAHHLSESEVSTLAAKAMSAKATAYCPYSNFQVGATIFTHDGQYISGANIENASYPVALCAERVAFARAMPDGRSNFKALAVASNISPAATPCGMCRQFIREFCLPDFPIFMIDKEGKQVVMTLEELLPMSFGPEALRPPKQIVGSESDKQTSESMDKKEK